MVGIGDGVFHQAPVEQRPRLAGSFSVTRFAVGPERNRDEEPSQEKDSGEIFHEDIYPA